jgi:hypothetical protein
MTGFSFDRIVLDSGGGFRPISLEEWRAISRSERLRIILSGSVRFLRGEEPVPTKEALVEINGRVS